MNFNKITVNLKHYWVPGLSNTLLCSRRISLDNKFHVDCQTTSGRDIEFDISSIDNNYLRYDDIPQ